MRNFITILMAIFLFGGFGWMIYDAFFVIHTSAAEIRTSCDFEEIVDWSVDEDGNLTIALDDGNTYYFEK